MPTYSYTYNVEVPEVDATMTTNIALTCTTADLRLVNILSGAETREWSEGRLPI